MNSLITVPRYLSETCNVHCHTDARVVSGVCKQHVIRNLHMLSISTDIESIYRVRQNYFLLH